MENILELEPLKFPIYFKKILLKKISNIEYILKLDETEYTINEECIDWKIEKLNRIIKELNTKLGNKPLIFDKNPTLEEYLDRFKEINKI